MIMRKPMCRRTTCQTLSGGADITVLLTGGMKKLSRSASIGGIDRGNRVIARNKPINDQQAEVIVNCSRRIIPAESCGGFGPNERSANVTSSELVINSTEEDLVP